VTRGQEARISHRSYQTMERNGVGTAAVLASRRLSGFRLHRGTSGPKRVPFGAFPALLPSTYDPCSSDRPGSSPSACSWPSSGIRVCSQDPSGTRRKLRGLRRSSRRPFKRSRVIVWESMPSSVRQRRRRFWHPVVQLDLQYGELVEVYMTRAE
jgi:hypothetical protein